MKFFSLLWTWVRRQYFLARILESLSTKDILFAVDDELGMFKFSGWKGHAATDGFVAQWFYYSPKIGDLPRVSFYVNLPNMQHGPFLQGESFVIGSERVRWDTDPAKLQELIEQGFRLLLQDVIERYGNQPYSTAFKLKKEPWPSDVRGV